MFHDSIPCYPGQVVIVTDICLPRHLFLPFLLFNSIEAKTACFLHKNVLIFRLKYYDPK